MKIFKPFIDGILKYDCKKCGGSCCLRIERICFDKRIWRILSKDYPFLKYFIYMKEEKPEPFVYVKGPGCSFVDKDGLCFIHKKYGYKLKPSICKAHPYYVYICNDEFIISPMDRCEISLTVRRNVVKNKEANEESKTI